MGSLLLSSPLLSAGIPLQGWESHPSPAPVPPTQPVPLYDAVKDGPPGKLFLPGSSQSHMAHCINLIANFFAIFTDRSFFAC